MHADSIPKDAPTAAETEQSMSGTCLAEPVLLDMSDRQLQQ